jgi:hypothetical protein
MRKLFGTSASPESTTPQAAPRAGRELLVERELYARWYMELRLEEEIQRAQRYERPLSVLVAGPALIGEEAPAPGSVEAAAAAARSAARMMDLVGWVDGVTVLMVLPDTSVDEARAAASRWRSEMWLRSRSFGGQKWEIRLAGEWTAEAAGDGAERVDDLMSRRGSLELAA